LCLSLKIEVEEEEEQEEEEEVVTLLVVAGRPRLEGDDIGEMLREKEEEEHGEEEEEAKTWSRSLAVDFFLANWSIKFFNDWFTALLSICARQ